MEVETHLSSRRIDSAVKMLTELLLADYPSIDAAKAAYAGQQAKSRRHGQRRTGRAGRAVRGPTNRASPSRPRSGRSTNRRWSSPSTTTPASSATAASGPATTSATTTSSAGPARAITPGSPSTRRPDGQLLLRRLRRVHDLLPDRRPDPASTRSSAARTQPGDRLGRGTGRASRSSPGVSKALPRLQRRGPSSAGTSRRGTSSAARGTTTPPPSTSRRARSTSSSARPFKHVKNRPQRRLMEPLRPGPPRACWPAAGEDRREEERTPSTSTIDAPVVLRYDKPVATLGAGDIFGEMACMSSYPRSATVVAEDGLLAPGDGPERPLHPPARASTPRPSSTSATARTPSTTTSGACRSSPRWSRTRTSSSNSSTTSAPGLISSA